MKKFNGKAIYQPAGKAQEYAQWACNFYVCCSNGCTYCYLKKGIGKAVLGGDKPTLKKCFKDEAHAFEVFEKELMQNIDELRKHGIFFSFTTDPMLDETWLLTLNAAEMAVHNLVPVKILTKMADWVDNFIYWLDNSNSYNKEIDWRKMYAFGFTLTGHDEIEPGSSTNAERIEAMKKLHDAGFRTFASIEPVIDFESSLEMIIQSARFCDLYKIGLESGKKYDKKETKLFLLSCMNVTIPNANKIYFKDSILKAVEFNRNHFMSVRLVNRDYNLFKK